MHVDCDTCAVRGTACGGCVISVMLGAPPEGVELDPEEHRALRVLADAGIVPELRLVSEEDPGPPPPGHSPARRGRHAA